MRRISLHSAHPLPASPRRLQRWLVLSLSAALALTMLRQTLADNLGLEAATLGGVAGNLTILPPLPASAEIEAVTPAARSRRGSQSLRKEML